MWDVRGLRPIRALELWPTPICENQSKTGVSLKLRNLKKSAVGKNCFSAVGMAIARVKTGGDPDHRRVVTPSSSEGAGSSIGITVRRQQSSHREELGRSEDIASRAEAKDFRAAARMKQSWWVIRGNT